MANLIPFNWKKNQIRNHGFDGFSNMLEDFFEDDFFGRRSLVNDSFKIDLRDNGNEYVVEAEVPGVKKEDIDISYDNNSLKISINKEENIDKSEKNYIHRERRLSSMERRIMLADINDKEIKAKLDNGLLIITLPKKNSDEKALKITID
jgi:HSP20 family protein